MSSAIVLPDDVAAADLDLSSLEQLRERPVSMERTGEPVRPFELRRGHRARTHAYRTALKRRARFHAANGGPYV